MAERWIHGACPHDCPDTCGLQTRVEDGRAVAVRGAALHPLTRGWLCTKVRDYLDWVYHPERILTPLRRVGAKGSGRFERISWDAALTTIAERWQRIIAEDGGAAILPYSYSGTLGLLQMGVANERLWRRIGASGLRRSICGAAAETAVQATLGARWAPQLADLEHARLILLWGHNPASTAPHVMPALRAAQRQGCRVVLIDPRRTLTAKSVDLHLAPRPATDGALALGLMHVLAADGLVDQRWLEKHARGHEALLERARDYPPARVAAITGLPSSDIVTLARAYGQTKPALIKIADGLQRHGNGGQTVRAIASLPALVGAYGQRGGGLSYSTSDTLRWDPEAMTGCHDVQGSAAPRQLEMNRLGAVLTAAEGSDELKGGPPVRSLFVFGANPLCSSPNAARIEAGLARDDLFTVVHELFLTDTARYADIVLPATSQLEQIDLHKAYGHTTLTLNKPAIAPRGEARSNWDTQRALAAALGCDEPWLQADGERVLREILEATAPTQPALEGIDYARLEREGSVPLALLPARAVPFSDGVFPTPSGKVELSCAAMQAEGLDALPDYQPPGEFKAYDADAAPAPDAPLVLLSGAAHHFVSSSLHPLSRLRRLEGAPCIELHPDDARIRGIEDATPVRVRNDRGEFLLQARVTDAVRTGVAFAAKGHWAQTSVDGRNVNHTTSDALGDLAGQSTFHSNLVWVEPTA